MSDEIPKMLAASVLDMSKEAVNKTYQLVGFLLLIGGWIATSTDARTLIQGHVGIVTCGLVLAALLYIVGLYGLKRKIDQVMALLQEHETWAKAAMPFTLGKQFWALCVMVMMTVAALISLLFFN